MTATLTPNRLSSDIRSLSSGTISKLLRDNYFADLKRFYNSRYQCCHSLQVNPLQSQDGWIVDRVQFAFARYADACHNGQWKCWQDVWTDYLRSFGNMKFVCAYMGEADFTFEGKRYANKHHVSNYEKSIYNGSGEKFEQSVVPYIGTIRREYGMVHGFPPEQVSLAFPFATPVRLVKTDDGYERVFHPDYPMPRIGTSPCGDRCSYEHDKKFDAPVDLYLEWREKALKS